ncbi:MAG TPA: methyltransferase domain-containing protein [Thermoanaerobaculia bacterium]|nr:methyltransferase domain-containing protein [Thermoanaerobaculia bacterium]
MCCCGKNSEANQDEDIQLIELVVEDEEDDDVVATCRSAPDQLPDCSTFADYNEETQWAMPEITENNIVLTGRTLFLREVLNTHVVKRKRYGRGTSNPDRLAFYNKARGWNGESYSGLLRLSDRDLARLRGAEVLDLGGGQGLFIEEAAMIGITVTSVDINRDRYIVLKDGPTQPFPGQQVNVNQITHEEKARAAYVKNMEAIYCRDQADDFIHDDVRKTFNAVFSHRTAIANSFMDVSQRVRGDATDLSRFGDDSFDAVISVWMLCYLNEDERAQVVAEAVRVTRPGGQIRIYGGDNTKDRREAIEAGVLDQWFAKWPRVGGKTCLIDDEKSEGGLVSMTVR